MWNRQIIIFCKKGKFDQDFLFKAGGQNNWYGRSTRLTEWKKHKRTSNMSKRILRQQAQSTEKESARRMPMTPLQGSTETEWK